jgi:polysaccharide pyruvyl transferase WcaK-like protein
LKKNILLSTTRQWNPGDEFIALGVTNVLKSIIGDFNPIIFNRNPEIRQPAMYLNPLRKSSYSDSRYPSKRKIEAFLRVGFLDNSFKDEMDSGFIDMAIFAGTPEWQGARLKGMYNAILKYDIPTVFLGIGSGSAFKVSSIKDLYKTVLEKALLITVRDELSMENLAPLNPLSLPCPALLSSSFSREIKEVQKIGLIYGTPNAVANNRISKCTHEYILSLFGEIRQKYDCEIICHYIDELPDAHRHFTGMNIHYSYDSKDYVDIYNKFDLVIGHRVHGVGMAASMGVPGILIKHDHRGGTGKGFLADVITVEQKKELVMEMIEDKVRSVAALNAGLILHKKDVFGKYLKLMNDVIKKTESRVSSTDQSKAQIV